MSIKIFYNTEEERLNIIIENQGKQNIEDKKEKCFYYLEEDEIIIDGKIVKNENYINELKEGKIEELKKVISLYIEEEAKEQYDIKLNLDENLTINKIIEICSQLNKTFEELFDLIKLFFDNIKSVRLQITEEINILKIPEKIKEYDVKKRFDELIGNEEEEIKKIREEIIE